MLSVTTILFVLSAYFGLLIFISYLTSKKSSADTFFTGDRNSPWYVVAFGMIGASLSGVTFISVTGSVSTSSFSYMQMVLGYIPGYFIIAFVLIPLYYRLNLVSIYKVLEQKFGKVGFRLGSIFFLISRTIGSSFRLYLVSLVLQKAIFERIGMPFILTIALAIALIYIYTYRGGIKTVVWTDTLQTVFMLSAVCLTIYAIKNELNYDWSTVVETVRSSELSTFYFDDLNDGQYFWKQFLSGGLIALVMTGLDQDMMQKNLTCKSPKDAQKNLITLSLVLIPVNFIFLSLGVLLYHYAGVNGIELPSRTDEVFTYLSMFELPAYVGVIFILGITAAAYSSADSALTALTTSFCFDFLDFENKETKLRDKQKTYTHIGFSIIIFLVILVFEKINDQSVISAVFKVAGYTYGPLLGLFILAFIVPKKEALKQGLLNLFIPICFISPAISYVLDAYSEVWFNGFQFGYLILLINGLITFIGIAPVYYWASKKES